MRIGFYVNQKTVKRRERRRSGLGLGGGLNWAAGLAAVSQPVMAPALDFAAPRN